jgi:hypothetical protein
MTKESTLSELFDYLQQIVFEVESGRMTGEEAGRRFVTDWGGVRVRGYIPARHPQERIEERTQIEALKARGIPERTARLKVRGK